MRAPVTGRIGIFSSGLWRLRTEVGWLSGLTPVRGHFGARRLDAVAGWGHKPTAAWARWIARRHGLPYLAIEDGFLRSVAPGDEVRSLSYVVDPLGIYYDATGPSALEALVLARSLDPDAAARDAAPAISAIRDLGVSKYNLFDSVDRDRFLAGSGNEEAVLLVDQTAGDAAVSGAGAGRATFMAMLVAAATENPGRRLLLKTHPETQIGRRHGYLDAQLVTRTAAASPAVSEALRRGLIQLVNGRISPLVLFDRAVRVYTVSSLLGLEAIVAGVPTIVFGQAFYAGWGLTDDRAPPTGRRRSVPLACVVAAAYADYARYFCPVDRHPCDIDTVISHLAEAAGRGGRR